MGAEPSVTLNQLTGLLDSVVTSSGKKFYLRFEDGRPMGMLFRLLTGLMVSGARRLAEAGEHSPKE